MTFFWAKDDGISYCPGPTGFRNEEKALFRDFRESIRERAVPPPRLEVGDIL
jgi:hypothetical protein